MKKVIFMLAAAAAMASCSQTDIIDNNPNTDGVLIQAKPVHQLVDGSVTRAPFIGNISSTNALEAQVLTYDADGDIYANGLMNFASTSDPVAYTSVGAGQSKKFENQNADLYTMYGLYPATGWSTAAAMATDALVFPFTGKEDVMVTAKATTSADAVAAGTYPALTFKHQLTKFIVKVQAMDAGAAAVWKDLSDISLTQVKGSTTVCNKATYNLASNEVNFTKDAVADPISFWVINGATYSNTTTFTGQTAAIEVPNATASNIVPVAYAMVAPFQAVENKDIQLSVTAQFDELADGNFDDATKQINLNIPAVASTAGYAYTITLTFTDKQTIVATAEVIDWIDGDEVGGIIM